MVGIAILVPHAGPYLLPACLFSLAKDSTRVRVPNEN
jgi:hypothetical protein